MDVCNFFSGIVLGMTLYDIGLQPLLARKYIPVLIFLTAITALIYIFFFEILAMVPMDPNSTSYIAVGVLMNIMDGVSSIPFTLAMISRLVAILPSNGYKKYLYVVMIVPLVYPIVDIYAILLLVGFPLNPQTSLLLFAIGGFAYGLTFFCLDVCVTVWLVRHNTDKHKWVFYFPFFAGLGYMVISIVTALDPNFDSTPIYLAYSIDILAYQQVSRNLTNVVLTKGSGSDSDKNHERESVRGIARKPSKVIQQTVPAIPAEDV
ncbi:hypothetical protein HK103_002233 [Boothiomyces macroporosus]|uniref:Uncharacterized protein n=1 Tax=Boothiomyces macroporosus TaxID=261099 RepID=A0AAD5U9R7_9FUNG|nr:hypothetical protein HK103_002228 [Boothiomyces macroporosus]KAJ3251619.1 hypothetical protein HK103_002233 [Boothiomyces macroporosus]